MMRGNHIGHLGYTRDQVHDLLALFRLRIVVWLVLGYLVYLLILLWREFGDIIFDTIWGHLKSIFAGLLIGRWILLMMWLRSSLDISSFERWITTGITIYGRNVDDTCVRHPSMDHKPLSRPVAIFIVNSVKVGMCNQAQILFFVHHS
jgi:phosphoglycerol transferase MdoB-like AlkP superfamily enzyme